MLCSRMIASQNSALCIAPSVSLPPLRNDLPVSLLESAFTHDATRKSFRIRSYGKHRGWGYAPDGLGQGASERINVEPFLSGLCFHKLYELFFCKSFSFITIRIAWGCHLSAFSAKSQH